MYICYKIVVSYFVDLICRNQLASLSIRCGSLPLTMVKAVAIRSVLQVQVSLAASIVRGGLKAFKF